jgi:tRNA uridine 5-carbamoylmethylation protein Kti12
MSLIVIGHSCSGKTTWSKKFCQENDYKYVDLGVYKDEFCERYGWKQLLPADCSKLLDLYLDRVCVQALLDHQGENCVFDGIDFLSLPMSLLKPYSIVVVNPAHDVIIERYRNRCKNHPVAEIRNLSDEQINDLAKAMIKENDYYVNALIPSADIVV